MPFQYDPPPAALLELRQGEILEDVWEHRPVHASSPAQSEPAAISVHHPVVVVVAADCDLLQDFTFRPKADPEDHHLLAHVLLCESFAGDVLKPRFAEKRLWRRIEQNQDVRYHRLRAAEVRVVDGAPADQLDDLYLDFKRAFGLPAESIYHSIVAGHIRRRAVVPPIYLHDLIQRLYSFLARVGLPDEEPPASDA